MLVIDNDEGHVNNVTYVRYAESGRINWAQNYANFIDPKHKREWSELWTPSGEGLILRSIKTDFKFVRSLLAPSTQRLISSNVSPSPWPGQIGYLCITNFAQHLPHPWIHLYWTFSYCPRHINGRLQGAWKILSYMITGRAGNHRCKISWLNNLKRPLRYKKRRRDAMS